jgi:hypothetical protein
LDAVERRSNRRASDAQAYDLPTERFALANARDRPIALEDQNT